MQISDKASRPQGLARRMMTHMSIFQVSESIEIIQICFPMKISKDD
jgi:hypothetical protein